jgi:hypothetical protein
MATRSSGPAEGQYASGLPEAADASDVETALEDDGASSPRLPGESENQWDMHGVHACAESSPLDSEAQDVEVVGARPRPTGKGVPSHKEEVRRAFAMACPCLPALNSCHIFLFV